VWLRHLHHAETHTPSRPCDATDEGLKRRRIRARRRFLLPAGDDAVQIRASVRSHRLVPAHLSCPAGPDKEATLEPFEPLEMPDPEPPDTDDDDDEVVVVDDALD